MAWQHGKACGVALAAQATHAVLVVGGIEGEVERAHLCVAVVVVRLRAVAMACGGEAYAHGISALHVVVGASRNCGR